ncbi:MAG: hypothetical protein AB4368_29990 [Xenococcaceae cyanobacterium]
MLAHYLSWFIFTTIVVTTNAALAQTAPTNRISNLTHKLQESVDSQNLSEALEITNLLIDELTEYQLQLRKKKGEFITTENSDLQKERRSQFGRELVLEASAAHSDKNNICVLGKIRNNSRSPINLPVYVIADFFTNEGMYLGSSAERINLQPILPNQTTTFTITNSQAEQLMAQTIKLRFQGVNTEGRIALEPTANSRMILPVSYKKIKCQ